MIRSRGFSPIWSLLLVGTSILISMGSMIAAQAQMPNNWLSQKTMTGNWNGARKKLESIGISPHGYYIGDFADAVSGGKRQGDGYAQEVNFGANVDLNRLAGLKGGKLHINFDLRYGHSVTTQDIGNVLQVQQDFGAGETLRLAEISYKQSFDKNFIDTQVGFFPIGNDFASTTLLCDFQNVGFCAHPQNLPDSSGWSDYPTGKWGGVIKMNVKRNFYVEAGVADVNPGYYAHTNGLKVSLSGSTGALIPVEVGVTTALGSARLPGHYKIGAYYDTSSTANVAIADRVDNGRYGAYLLADQMLFSFDGTNKRGLIGFAQASFSDPRTAVFANTLAAGFVAEGPFASRPHDFFDVGYVRAGINHRAINAESIKLAAERLPNYGLEEGEGIVEVGYGLQATPWLLIHPNVQYVDNPGAFSYKHTPNAWVFGLQTKVIF